MPWESASDGRDNHNRNSLQVAESSHLSPIHLRWPRFFVSTNSSFFVHDIYSYTSCHALTVITEHVISLCLLMGEQQYAMQRAHLHTACKIYCALGRCMRSSWYVYHQPMKVEAHSYSWITCLSDTIHSVQHIALSLLDIPSNSYIMRHHSGNNMCTPQAWTDLSSKGPVKGELPACCILSPKSVNIFSYFEQQFLRWCISRTANKIQWSYEAAFKVQEGICVRMNKRHSWKLHHLKLLSCILSTKRSNDIS